MVRRMEPIQFTPPLEGDVERFSELFSEATFAAHTLLMVDNHISDPNSDFYSYDYTRSLYDEYSSHVSEYYRAIALNHYRRVNNDAMTALFNFIRTAK